MKMRISFSVFVLILIIIFTGCGLSSPDKKDKTKPKESLPLLWTYEYSYNPMDLSLVNTYPTIINDSYVLIAPDYHITCLNPQTGKQLWQVATPDSAFVMDYQLLHDATYLYTKTHKHNELVIREISSGQKIDESTLPFGKFYDAVSDAMSDTSLYLCGDNPYVYEFNKQGEYIASIPLRKYARAVAYGNGQLFVSQAWKPEGATNDYGRIVSIDPLTKNINWEYNTKEKGGYYKSPLIIEDSVIYAGTTEGPGEFVALDAATGQVKWKVDGLMCWRFTIGDGRIFVNNGAGVVALDQQTGEQLWAHDFGSHDETNVAYLDGYVYNAHGHGMYVYDAQTGEIVLGPVNSPDGSDFNNVAAANGKVFIESNFHFYAYEAYTQQ